MNKQNAADFSQGSIGSRIMAQAIPLSLAEIVQLLYNIVDRIYIGHIPVYGAAALTGVGVTIGGITYTDHSTSDVEVDDIPDDALLAYVQSGDPMDKAGSYGIQGEFSRWVRGIRGCYFGIVGLPVNCLNRLYHSCTGEYLGR